MTSNLALISQSKTIMSSEVIAVSAAIQKQIMRDFTPLWNISATIDFFQALEDVPVGYWPVIIVDEIVTGDLGIHGQRDKQPIALVQAKADWSLTASHEVLEMLADPYSSRLIGGDSVVGDGKRVEYLVEICDPCQDAAFGYQINGVLVSDFYTPNYFNASGTAGAQYDYLGKMPRPRTVLEGGYLSWRDPLTNHLFRADMISSQLFVFDLGVVPPTAVSLRSHVDAMPTPLNKKLIKQSAVKSPKRVGIRQQLNHRVASQMKAERLRKQFSSLNNIAKYSQIKSKNLK